MSELIISTVEDIKKLEGWQIVKPPTYSQDGVTPVLALELSHPAAEKHVILQIRGVIDAWQIKAGASIPFPGLQLRTGDVK